MKTKLSCLFLLIAIIALAISSCKVSNTGVNAYHSRFDDSSLLIEEGPVLLPYNRFIDPAGTTIRFGDPELENHSLDCIVLPGGKVLAVEDRYGLAFIDIQSKKVVYQLSLRDDKVNKGLMSTYSGIKALQLNGATHLYWAAANSDTKQSVIMEAVWNGKEATMKLFYEFAALAPAPLALPNDIAMEQQDGKYFMYVVLNGNNQLCKISIQDKKTVWTARTGMAPFGLALSGGKCFVTNWAGPVPTDTSLETAGIPYGNVYINHRTGGVCSGTVSVLDTHTGSLVKEIPVGLHPNAIIVGPDGRLIYAANGNSDNISVIDAQRMEVIDSIPVRLNSENNFFGDSPNALVIDKSGKVLYVANGMDNAVAVVNLEIAATGSSLKSHLAGFIPTCAYPAGLALDSANLYVSNLEGEGARIPLKKGFNAHHQGAIISIIPIPAASEIKGFTERVHQANMTFRARLTQRMPRTGVAPVPVPERIGEPSLIKHVIYIIKENRTYDQVMGDAPGGNGSAALCIYGDSVTPNQHRLARDFSLLDNYYVSGKSSAEGHQWTDAAMTSDYIEKNVRAWFRSYPHVQNDALVYNKEGFIWNNALDHGKTVRIYGEACDPVWDKKLGWKEIYERYRKGEKVEYSNETTISRVRPILSHASPCADTHDFSDVMRADGFISELNEYEKKEGDQWPQLMLVSLSDDHTAGLRPGLPTPRAMVADNDLAVGKIVEAVSHSRFWNSTAIFITEDDSQDGWDHVSAYRTTGFVVSPYSALHKTVHTNYNQTCMVRTIEQILGLPPMNVIDATALPMFGCFRQTPDTVGYRAIASKIPLDEMNKEESMLKGQELYYAVQSSGKQFDGLDGGDDDLLNRILWFAAKGNKPFPKRKAIDKGARDDD